MKKMDENQAWLYLYDCVSNNLEKDSKICYRINVLGYLSYGLCNCLNTLLRKRKINKKTFRLMKEKITSYCGGRYKQGYIWGFTKQSNKRRAKFCLKMAGKSI